MRFLRLLLKRRHVMTRPATEVFSAWAASNRDVRMEIHHAAAVEEMLSAAIATLGSGTGFTAIDAGCGNGWTVRRLRQSAGCRAATGVDGSPGMIAKARSQDPEGDYVLADLDTWAPVAPVDLVISMEVLYYMSDPMDLLRHIRFSWLKPGGCAVFGIDHYLENEPSLSWPDELHVRMTTWPEARWRAALEEAGFTIARAWRAAAKPGAAGTLAMLATAPASRTDAGR